MNGLDVNIIYPNDGDIQEGDPIHFSVQIFKQDDQLVDNDFDKVDKIILRILDPYNEPIFDQTDFPIINNNNEKHFRWIVNKKLFEGPYVATAIIETKDPKDKEPLKDRIKSKPFLVNKSKKFAPIDANVNINGPVELAKSTEISIKEPIFKSPINVSLQETKRIESADQLLWVMIRNRTIKFDKYNDFINGVMTNDKGLMNTRDKQRSYLYANRLPFNSSASYSLLKFATEKYLMQECGLVPRLILEDDPNKSDNEKWGDFVDLINKDQRRTARYPIDIDSKIDIKRLKKEFHDDLFESQHSLPYLKLIKDKLGELPDKDLHEVYLNLITKKDGKIDLENDAIIIEASYGILPGKLQSPCLLELIRSYWDEEGGLVQTMNAISLRFKNIRNGTGKDPLANFNIDPLRPLSNLLWGYIEDERNRLSMSRRNLEYQYEYGISLIGKAVPQIGVVEHRTNFLRAFHNLLKVALDFYNQANFTTVIPDAFPLLNHLREVHFILAEGAHNQYGDLPWTSRVEMLIQQWLLSRQEMREFLGGRIMVPYNEPWMDKVDSMKTLQGWNVPNVTHFHDLGVFGEQLLLSIRYGNWNATTKTGVENAANWAHYWRNEVQRYVHAYNAVTGVDLSAEITESRVKISTIEDRYTPPAFLIQKQAALQKSRQQYALQSNVVQPSLLQNRPDSSLPIQTIPVTGQKKLNG